jgi:outer membrane murein-binding lipoprotein Lpp
MKRFIQGNVFVLAGVTLAGLVILGAALGVYAWRQQKIDDLNNRVNSLSQQVSKLENAQITQKLPATSNTSYRSAKGVAITVYSPARNARVSSPLAVIGQVPGSWSFESSFPIVLKDSTGKVVAQGTGQVLGTWTTDQLVPFSAKLTYATVPSGKGTLTLQKDNPSGLAANEDTVSVPVQF